MIDRPKFFAIQFIRLLTKTATAQELGADACWLLSIIACQEDAKRYTEPAKWYYEQLMPLCGFRSPKQLRKAINDAVLLGWLEYDPGSKGKPCKFSVRVPDAFKSLPPNGCDESTLVALSGNECGNECGNESVLVALSGNESAPKGERIGHASIPIPIPNPNTCPNESDGSESPKKKPRGKNPSKTPEGFEEWYALYPNKKSRGTAEKAYEIALEEIQANDSVDRPEGLRRLMEWTSERMPAIRSREVRYRPLPASWLNAKSYRDELDGKSLRSGDDPYEAWRTQNVAR